MIKNEKYTTLILFCKLLIKYNVVVLYMVNADRNNEEWGIGSVIW